MGSETHRADFLLAKAFLISLGVILINDLVLKPHFPSVVSGKASDVAGMIFFPLLLVAVCELCSRFLPARPLATPVWFVMGTAFVAVAFVAVKFSELGGDVYQGISAPILAVAGPLSLGTRGAVSDPWDLLALVFLPLPILVGRRYRQGGGTIRKS